jgi:DNA-binding transcriptional ArsR family regulator
MTGEYMKFMAEDESRIGRDDSQPYGILSRIFSSRAAAQILDFFLDHKEYDYSASEIARKTGLSFRTIFREMPDLENSQLVYNSRRIGKTNMYKLNVDLTSVLLLERFALEMSMVMLPEPAVPDNKISGDLRELASQNDGDDSGFVKASYQ